MPVYYCHKGSIKNHPLVPAPLLKCLQVNVLVSGLGWAQGFLRVCDFFFLCDSPYIEAISVSSKQQYSGKTVFFDSTKAIWHKIAPLDVGILLDKYSASECGHLGLPPSFWSPNCRIISYLEIDSWHQCYTRVKPNNIDIYKVPET